MKDIKYNAKCFTHRSIQLPCQFKEKEDESLCPLQCLHMLWIRKKHRFEKNRDILKLVMSLKKAKPQNAKNNCVCLCVCLFMCVYVYVFVCVYEYVCMFV